MQLFIVLNLSQHAISLIAVRGSISFIDDFPLDITEGAFIITLLA